MFAKHYFLALVTVIAVLLIVCVPVASGQAVQSVKIEFTAFEGNPLFDKGPSDSWDGGIVIGPSVVFYDGLYYLFYYGDCPTWKCAGIGYATSVDGLVWERYAGNPVLKADGTGWDTGSVGGSPLVTVEGDTWVIYYIGQKTAGVWSGAGAGRATAPSPSGPWTRAEEPLLTLGSVGEWDQPAIDVHSVIATDDGYVMYYAGGSLLDLKDGAIGMATSPDGIHWTKYDDPTTTEHPYSESDPVLLPGPEEWDLESLGGGSVLHTANHWEMFYLGKGKLEGQTGIVSRIGYAFSEDGIHWTKYDGNPILTAEGDPAEPSYTHINLGVNRVIVRDSTYFLYYDYLWQMGGGIGVATGTVMWE
jgi:hypothetical protein